MVRFNVVVAAPRLAQRAHALPEAAGCAVYFMDPYPSEAAAAALVDRVQADAVLSRQGRVGEAAMAASPRLRIVARLAQAFGMAVRAQDPAVPGLDFLPSLAELLAGSDAVSLHRPLTPATRHLIDAATLAALPRGGLVLNTARGGLIDERALLAALESRHLAEAALDVTSQEPPEPGSRLRTHPRVILTPHVAGATPSALEAMGCIAAECIVVALTGGAIPPARIVTLPERD